MWCNLSQLKADLGSEKPAKFQVIAEIAIQLQIRFIGKDKLEFSFHGKEFSAVEQN
jgi:hypothetical protein